MNYIRQPRRANWFRRVAVRTCTFGRCTSGGERARFLQCGFLAAGLFVAQRSCDSSKVITEKKDMGRKRRPLNERPPKGTVASLRPRREPSAIEPTRIYCLKELPPLLRIGRDSITAEIKAGRLKPFVRCIRQLFLGEELLRWARDAMREQGSSESEKSS